MSCVAPAAEPRSGWLHERHDDNLGEDIRSWNRLGKDATVDRGSCVQPNTTFFNDIQKLITIMYEKFLQSNLELDSIFLSDV